MLKEIPDKPEKKEEVPSEVIKVADLVKLRKSDMKDKKKKEKIEQIVLYAFQEVLKNASFQDVIKDGKKKAADVIKMESFRNQVMAFIESHFYLAGFTDKVAILGQNFSYEAKASR